MIQSIKLTHTNPSMGPYERIISYSLNNSEVHQAAFNQLINKSTVNGNFDFQTFLTAYKTKDLATIDKIRSADYNGALNQGQTISKLQITLKSGVVIEVPDLRTTRFSGYYPEFIRYLVEHGFRDEFSANGIFDKPVEIKEDIINKIDDTDLSI